MALHHAEDFRALLGLVNLMRSVNPNANVKGQATASLGKLLEQVSSLLLRMRNIYKDVNPVQK